MRLHEIARRAASSGGGVVAASAVAFLLTVGLSRLLSPAVFGAVAVAQTWAAIGSQMAQMGFLRASTKVVATARATDDRPALKSYLLFAFGAATIGSLLGAFLLIFAGGDRLLKHPALAASVLAAALLWPMAIGRVVSGVLLGEKRNFLGSFAQTGLPNIGILAGLLAFILLGLSETTFGVSTTLAGGALAAAAVGILIVGWISRDLRGIQRGPYQPAEWLALAFPLMIVSVIQTTNRQVATVFLGSISGPEAVAAYYPAFRVSDFAGLGLMGINAALGPHIAVLFREGKREQLQALLTKAAAISLGSTAGLVFLGIIFAPHLLALFGGHATEGTLALQILLGAQLVNAATGSAAMLAAMAGEQRFTAVTALVILVVNVALLLALVPGTTTVGAAIATATASVLWNLMLFVRCNRRLGLDPSILSLRFADVRRLVDALRR